MKLGPALLLVVCAAGCQEKQATAPAEAASPAPAARTATPTSAGSDDCGHVVARLRLAAARQLPPVLDPKSQMLLGNAMREVRASCNEDGWSDALKRCALETTDLTDALSACRAHIPPELHAKLGARMAKVMAE